MAVEELVPAILLTTGIALLYVIYARNWEQVNNREYLAGMKEQFFPQLLENLRMTATRLETNSESTVHRSMLEDRLSPTMLWQFRIRFPKPYKKFDKLRKNLVTYHTTRYEIAIAHTQGIIELEKEQVDERSALIEDVTGLIKEIEPLTKLKKLPPKILPFVNRA